jgi:predicted dehydrogenase
MVVYDDLEPSEKVKIYDRSITLNTPSESVYQLMVGYRVGDMWAPRVSLTEALRVETQHFVECVRTGRQPMTDGRSGLRVVRVLEAAGKSLKRGGEPVEVDWEGKYAVAGLPPPYAGSGDRTIGGQPRTQVG